MCGRITLSPPIASPACKTTATKASPNCTASIRPTRPTPSARPDAGLVLRGASTSVTLAPVSDEIVVFSPGRPVTEAEKDFCLAFALPLNAPGLSIVCREPYFGDAPVADHPLAAL